MIIILTSSSSSSPRIYSGAQALEEEYLTYSETLPYIPSIKDLSLSKTSAQVITSPTRVWVLMRKDRNDGEEIVKKLKCNLSLEPLIENLAKWPALHYISNINLQNALVDLLQNIDDFRRDDDSRDDDWGLTQSWILMRWKSLRFVMMKWW